jgi:oxygen-independent coproporphyrinogen-3 oxidase
VAAPSFECKYELRHWAAPQAGFYGLGPGAFGFAGGHTTVNRLSVPRYCDDLESGVLPIVSALRVEEDELRHRYFALGVKALSVPLRPYRETFGRDPLDDFSAEIESLLSDNLAEIERDALVLTSAGRLYVDVCSATFYSSAEREVPHPEEPEIRKIELELSIENSSL